MRILTCILCLLLVLPCMAETKTWHGLRYKTVPDFDGWSMPHAALGATCYAGCRIVGMDAKWALGTAIFLGFAKELYVDGLGNPIPGDAGDPGGADFVGDFAWTAFGAATACITEGVLKVLSCRVVKLEKGVAITANIKL